jgi:nucleoside-diphosphate-sugar epimerase
MARLPHVHGARDLIFEQIRRGHAIYPGNGKNVFAHLHFEDAARVLIRAAERSWAGTLPVADQQPATWQEFFIEVRRYYPRLRLLLVPLMGVFQRFSDRPFLYTADAVRGANLSLPVQPGLLWDDLDLDPKYPSIEEGIPAALDELVAFRWLHPLADR